MAHEPKAQKEITPLNKEFLTFNLEDMALEELERRLELALMLIRVDGCSDCSAFSCDVNCGDGSRIDSCATFACGSNSDICDPT